MNAIPSYADIQAIVADDFAIMDKQVFGSLNSKVRLIMQVSKHVIDAGGKRMTFDYAFDCSNVGRYSASTSDGTCRNY